MIPGRLWIPEATRPPRPSDAALTGMRARIRAAKREDGDAGDYKGDAEWHADAPSPGYVFLDGHYRTSTSIQATLPMPTANMSSISDQQQPMQKILVDAELERSIRSPLPCQCSVIKASGERHLSRHMYLSGVNW